MTEIPKQIPGLPGYFITENGAVYSCKRTSTAANDAPLRRMKTSVYDGYERVSLFHADRRMPWGVHQLVLLAFVGQCPDGQETRHMNGDRLDNRLGNLCYGTPLQNAADRDLHGTTARGEMNGFRKVNDVIVGEIRNMAAAGASYVAIAEQFGISDVHAQKIATGKQWAHVGGPTVKLRSRVKIPREVIDQAIALRTSGCGIREISRKLNISSGYVSGIVAKRARKTA